MSIKLYNGYILPNWTHLETAEFLKSLRPEMLAAARKDYGEIFYAMATRTIDMHAVGQTIYRKGLNKTIKTIVPHIDANWYIMDKMKEVKRTGRRDPLFDFEASVCLIPTEGCLLALFYAERNVFTQIWESMEDVGAFGYWNNTDQPDDVSKKEWQDRGKLWDQALGHDGIPGAAGYTYDFILKYDLGMTTLNDFQNYLPTLENRVNDIAVDLFTKENFKNKKFDYADYLKFQRWFSNDPKGQLALALEKERVKSLLKSELTKEDFLQDIPVEHDES